MDYAIEVKNLVKQYKKSEKKAVDDISFNVKKGEFFAFLGPNGAGKTTIISILTTTLSKTSGSVKIAGFDIDSGARDVREHIGIIFQQPSLDPNLSAEENIRLHACLYGMCSYRPTFKMMPNRFTEFEADENVSDSLAGKTVIIKSLGFSIQEFSKSTYSKMFTPSQSHIDKRK